MNKKKLVKLARFLLVAACMAAVLSLTCFAATTDLGNKLESALDTIQRYVLIISSPICGICAIVCFIRMMITSDPKTHETMKSWLIRIIVAWVGINALALILNSVTSLLGVSGSYAP